MFKNIVAALCMIAFTNAAYSKEILMVLTESDVLTLKNGEKYKTGYWLEEFSVPYQVFVKNGIKVTVATTAGKRPPVDPWSVHVDEKTNKPLYWDTIEELNEALETKRKVLDEGKLVALNKMTEESLKKFDAVFFPGGHGPMEDMLDNRYIDWVLSYFHVSNKLTALVCHAPAVLVATKGNGFLYKGYKVTAFSNSEEAQTPVGAKMKTTPEKLLKEAGMIFVKGEDWESFVVEDRNLLTGQNPKSSKGLALKLVKRLE